MNKCLLTGRLTADIEIRQTQSGLAVTSFTLAVKRPREKDTTDFINCVAWRQQAEFLGRYFKKGDPVEVVGTLTSRAYEDKNGNKRTAFEVVCDDVSFCLKTEKSESKPAFDLANAKELTDEEFEKEFLDDLGEFEEVLSDGGVPF